MATPPPGRKPQGSPEASGGIPDGALIGGIAFLFGLVLDAWLAAGVGGFLQHGDWPGISFKRTPQALRHLATEPSDIEGAWSGGNGAPVEGLPGPVLFWLTALFFAMIFIAIGLFAAAGWARLTRPATQADSPTGPATAQAASSASSPSGTTRSRLSKPVAAPQEPARTPEPSPAAPEVPVTPSEPPAAPQATAHGPTEAPPQPSADRTATEADHHHYRPQHPLSEDALVPRARTIRPEIPVIGRSLHNALAYGLHLGRDQDDGTELYGGLDQTFSVFGPPRSGRTTRIVHTAVCNAPGPVIVTCDGPGTFHATHRVRSKTGPVFVFDPLQLTDTAQRIRWSPVDGCEDPAIADARARAILEPVRPLARTLLTDANTHQIAQALLRCWLHAAALDGRSLRQVQRWSHGLSAREPVKILRTAKNAAADWAGSLESTLTGHQQQLHSAQALVARALDALSQLHILNSCTPSPSERFRVESFTQERGTLYVVGEAVEAPRTRPGVLPLLAALVENVVEHGRRMAATSSSGRLDPPLLVALDDVATVAPIPRLPELVSVGGRIGIPVIAVFRSEEQARHRWGDRGAATIQQMTDIRIRMEAFGRAKVEVDGHPPVTSELPSVGDV